MKIVLNIYSTLVRLAFVGSVEKSKECLQIKSNKFISKVINLNQSTLSSSWELHTCNTLRLSPHDTTEIHRKLNSTSSNSSPSFNFTTLSPTHTFCFTTHHCHGLTTQAAKQHRDRKQTYKAIVLTTLPALPTQPGLINITITFLPLPLFPLHQPNLTEHPVFIQFPYVFLSLFMQYSEALPYRIYIIISKFYVKLHEHSSIFLHF